MTTPPLRAKQVFLDALDQPEPERAAWIRRACAGDEALAARVAALVAAQHGSSAILDPGTPFAVTRALLGELGPGTRIDAYVLLEQLGEGGFGQVWSAQQAQPVRRKVALKVVKLGMDTARVIARFEAERQVLALMEHPNIARVLDAGATPAGRPYFVMELVDGVPITHFCERHGLGLGARLELFRTVCLAVQHAHEKGVIHRDLKPSNVLVGMVDGQPVPKVIDFGIAKATDQRLTEHTLLTRDGQFVGTPAYMSPEQVAGAGDVDTRSDVYALGVLLHELLVGRPPFDGQRLRSADLSELQRIIREEEPRRPSQHPARGDATDPSRLPIPADLDWIVLRCLAKDRARRYASAAALARDVERFLGHEPVEAAPPSRLYALRKLVRRHRATAAVLVALGVGVLIAVVGLAAGLVSARAGERALRESVERERLERVKVLRLSAFQTLQDLVARAREAWPATPERVDAYEAWLADARALVAELDAVGGAQTPGHRAQLADLRARARVEEAADGTPRHAFATEEERWWHARLVELIAALEAFSDPETGLIEGVSAEHGLGVARRLAHARSVAELTTSGPDARRLWDAASAAVRADPRYAGLELVPQLGLVPLGPDPDSGLQEFACPLTGSVPERAADGTLALDEHSALVLVLIPGGRFVMGAQRADPSGPNHDPQAEDDEGPLRELAVAPFFLSKHEMTKAQWQRFSGADPSRYAVGMDFAGVVIDGRHPVEQMSWDQAQRVLARMDLALPSEAQWEYAARAGTSTPWSAGASPADLVGVVNVADEAARRAGATWSFEAGFDDGHATHAPVGTYLPNGFGLHEMHGNVWEWVLDGYLTPYGSGPGFEDAAGQAFLAPERSRSRITRGGGFATPFPSTRSANRSPLNPDGREGAVGLRPARAVRG